MDSGISSTNSNTTKKNEKDPNDDSLSPWVEYETGEWLQRRQVQIAKTDSETDKDKDDTQKSRDRFSQSILARALKWNALQRHCCEELDMEEGENMCISHFLEEWNPLEKSLQQLVLEDDNNDDNDDDENTDEQDEDAKEKYHDNMSEIQDGDDDVEGFFRDYPECIREGLAHRKSSTGSSNDDTNDKDASAKSKPPLSRRSKNKKRKNQNSRPSSRDEKTRCSRGEPEHDHPQGRESRLADVTNNNNNDNNHPGNPYQRRQTKTENTRKEPEKQQDEEGKGPPKIIMEIDSSTDEEEGGGMNELPPPTRQPRQTLSLSSASSYNSHFYGTHKRKEPPTTVELMDRDHECNHPPPPPPPHQHHRLLAEGDHHAPAVNPFRTARELDQEDEADEERPQRWGDRNNSRQQEKSRASSSQPQRGHASHASNHYQPPVHNPYAAKQAPPMYDPPHHHPPSQHPYGADYAWQQPPTHSLYETPQPRHSAPAERAKFSKGGPTLSAGLKRKFQPPKKDSKSSSSDEEGEPNVVSSRKPKKSSKAMTSIPNKSKENPVRASSKKAAKGEVDDDEEDVPEALRGLDAELISKIESEIVDRGETVTFNDIAGLQHAKQTVLELVCWPMKRPDLFTGLRRGPNGLLLFGPPGTGKTLIGKAIAYESGATFFSISSSSLTSKWIGEGEKLVRTLFAVARHREPAVVFMDEVDSLLTQRKSDENEASRRIKTEFLVQLDGTGNSATDARVLVIGATNRPHELDDAARRRFVKRLYVPLPAMADRQVLLERLLGKNNHCLQQTEIAKIAQDTEGFSGADLKALCADAALGPIRQLGARALQVDAKDIPPIGPKHFRRALRGTKPSVAQADLSVYTEWNALYGTTKNREDEEDEEDDMEQDAAKEDDKDKKMGDS